jgi:hypothetical protein
LGRADIWWGVVWRDGKFSYRALVAEYDVTWLPDSFADAPQGGLIDSARRIEENGAIRKVRSAKKRCPVICKFAWTRSVFAVVAILH